MPPPSDIEATVGRPEERAELRTKFKPDTLRKGGLLKNKKAIRFLLHV